MEDMARLALLEQNLGNLDKYTKVLHELLHLFNHILESPHDIDRRTIKNDNLQDISTSEVFQEYLKSIGFKKDGDSFTYPKEQSLTGLRMARVAVERKIYFCAPPKKTPKPKSNKKSKFTPATILPSKNPLLLKIEALFNNMLKYEDDELLELAREHIPVLTIQMKAIDRVRVHQMKIKAGDIKGPDLAFEIAQLMELMGWFKYKFFTWVDQPACERCGGPTKFRSSDSVRTETEVVTVEIYFCVACGADTPFPRYNDPRKLLETRRGRCGEWANCFTLMCRAMNYDTRYVYDTTDHVWCEIYDVESRSWLHCDPCEGKLNTPLMYCTGWKKRLSYVIAVSCDDLQDVTWRYTNNHKEVLQRRLLADEIEMILAILALRKHRQLQVSEPRRKYLARRCVQELVQMMVERQPSEYETHGRISGEEAWRAARGEGGAPGGHCFRLERPGFYCVRYHCSMDTYAVMNKNNVVALQSWGAGVYSSKNMFRKHEKDWNMVYLARNEGEPTGSISWKLTTNNPYLLFKSLRVRVVTQVYETGQVDWTIKFDSKPPESVAFGDTPIEFSQEFRDVELTAHLSGGSGDVAWQQAQLFRQSTDDKTGALEIYARVFEAQRLE